MKTRVISPSRWLLGSGAAILLGLDLGGLLWATDANYMGTGLGAVAMAMVLASVWVNAPRAT